MRVFAKREKRKGKKIPPNYDTLSLKSHDDTTLLLFFLSLGITLDHLPRSLRVTKLSVGKIKMKKSKTSPHNFFYTNYQYFGAHKLNIFAFYCFSNF